MKVIKKWLNESAYFPPISPACKMCAQGKKMVLLVTGLCSFSCFYCPLSFRKGGKDLIFADEWQLQTEDDTEKLIKEAVFIKASGAGITGGDPLLVWKRVNHYIHLLKDHFGPSFHLHLYTSGLKNSFSIPSLVDAGLDEIRFHPEPRWWSTMDQSPYVQAIHTALDTAADVALEVPVLPQTEEDLYALITWADTHDLKWINLNELEFSERNTDALLAKGYTVKDELSAAVQGSQETALSVLSTCKENDLSIGVHYCSVSFKDGVQLRNRIKRRAQSIATPYDLITNDGTLLKGTVTNPKISPTIVYKKLHDHYAIPQKYMAIDQEKKRVEVAAWILEDVAHDLKKQGYECSIVEEYPTADRLEVERTPLPEGS